MKKLLIGLLFLFVATGCTSGLTGRLLGRGPLALSDNNPYLASNLYVAESIKKSDVIRGFVQYKGLPQAVEIKSSAFEAPITILYYPKNNEYYKVEGEKGLVVITGPETIPMDILNKLMAITQIYTGVPILLEAQLEQVEEPIIEQNTPTFVEPVSTPVPTESKLDIIKRLQNTYASNKAEITPKGDLVHYVISDKDSLNKVTEWYTHDSSNIDKIERLNEFKSGYKLQIGDVVVVPKYLVKSTVLLNEEALTQF